MTEEQLRRIKERADNASVGWVAVDGLFVITLDDEGKYVVVAECDNEPNAYFIGEARQDIPNLLAEIERLKEIVLGIGRIAERTEVMSDDSDELYGSMFELENKCAHEVRNDRKERGLLLCEGCVDEYKAETSISKYFCGPCVDKNDMERLGWDIHGELGGSYYDED
jgi:hypothetical protein